jgi:hypothetical protein
MHGNAGGDLDHKDREDEAVQNVQDRADDVHDRRARLEAQDHRVDQNEAENGPLGPRILKQDTKAFDHGFLLDSRESRGRGNIETSI